ncbi:MAG TPA: cupin domain-containing protein [Rhizomicrobium sp.]
MRGALLGGAVLVFAIAPACAAEIAAPGAPKVTFETVAKTNTTIIGQNFSIPQNPNVVATIATFPPGASLPIHRHPYAHYVYVLDGVLTVTNAQTGQVFTVKKGDFIVEMVNTWHTGKNNGTVPVRLLTIDQFPAGVTSNVEFPAAK